jgi:signal transduction histidine kinase/CheY-like chemotaxis protein
VLLRGRRTSGPARRGGVGAIVVALVGLVASTVASRVVPAQPPGAGASIAVAGPSGWPAHETTVQFFGSRDGLDETAVYVVHRALDGTLRIGLDDGLSVYTGHRWVRDETPTPYAAQVRALLEFDGWLWIGGRAGVHRRLRDSVEVYDAVTGGLPDPTVYALDVTRAFGRATVVAATGRGIARWSGRGFVPVALPPAVVPIGLVLAETQGADGATPTLWVASATRGLAQLRNGQWIVEAADGETGPVAAEQLVPGPAGSGVELYAVGAGGVYERSGGRWRRVDSPTRAAYRVLPLTRANGGRELWVGTQEGELYRRLADGRWDSVSVARGRAATPVVALTAVPSPTGEPVVFVGLRGDRLARVAVGPAMELALVGRREPIFLRSLHVDEEGGRPVVWAGSIGAGVVRASPTGTTTHTERDGLPNRSVLAILPVRRDGRLEVWAATGTGPARWRGGRWESLPTNRDMRPATGLAEVRLPDGRRRVMVAAYDGLYVWRDERWVRDSLFPAGGAAFVGEAPGPEGWTVWSGGHRVYRRTATAWVEERPFGEALPSVVAVRALRLPGGDTATFVSGGGGFAWRRRSDTTWHRVSPATHRGLENPLVWQLASVGDRVYAATPRGVLQFRWVARDSLALDASYAEADGLPSSEVLSVAVGPGGRVYAGTVRGLGLLPLPSEQPATSPARLLAWVRRNADGTAIAPGAVLPHDVGVLDAELGLQSFHREDETRYRFAIDGSGTAPSAWTSRPTFTFAALRPGSYVLRAWARDWRGRESALAPIAFRVAAPWWASVPALVGYVVLLALAVAGSVWWRVASLKARADALEREERRVAASERKFRALFDRAQDAHLLVEGGRIVEANDAARLLVGASDAAAAAPWLAELGLPATTLDDGARLVRRADGTTVPAREQRTTIALEDRTLEHVVLRDVSAVRAARAEAARLEAQLRDAQKLESIGTLAGGVAHDFNNLLSVIRGNAELAQDVAAHGGTPADELGELLRATDRARDLVKQILTFSRRSPSRRERVDVAQLAHGLRGMLRATIPSTIELRLMGPTTGAWVDGDPTQLQQALLNLCTNAEHAMRATNGGRLTVTVQPATAAHGEVRVSVADTGTGMSPEVRARVFEPFFTTKPVGEGTGLGLSVLHGIVAAHGGRVELESAEGTGTRVTLVLPSASVAADAPTMVLPAADPPAVPMGSGQRVFVVDDEPAVRTIMARTLERLGYAVRAFDDARAALAAIADPATELDLLVTDQTMPGLTGDVLVQDARRHRPGLPAIVVTGYSHRLTPERVAALGVPVLSKPLSLAEFGHAVAEALAVSSPERSPG